VGRLFTSLESAWEYFLTRREPLERFFDQFPLDPDFEAECWIIEPPAGIKRAAAEVQKAFGGLRWIAPVPEHFLHVALGTPAALIRGPNRLSNSGAFEARYQRVNCFHSAIVVEVEAAKLHDFIEGTQVDAATFLPHMTIGVTRQERDPSRLREVLLPLRDSRLGSAKVTELKRVRFPAAQMTLLRPWSVVETVPLEDGGVR
jgi:2'-5' RNA ligase